MRAERHIPLFDKQLYTPQTLYLLPRDEGGLYNGLNYRLLKSFLLGQRTEDRVQMAITVCRDTTPFTFPFSYFRLSYPHPLSSPKLGEVPEGRRGLLEDNGERRAMKHTTGVKRHTPSGALLCPTSHWGVFLASHWRVLPSKGTKVYLILSLKALFAPQRAQNDIQSFL